ncbi:MAG: tetratricopeptide repeat protein [Polyangia bacterium]
MKTGTLVLAFLLAAPAAAFAADDPQVRVARIHLRAGMADYDEGRYAEAAAEMEQAYAQKPLPELQYNMAQCYDRLGRWNDAVRAYESYLAGTPPSNETELVKKRIVNLRERADAAAAGRAQTARAPEKVVFKTLVVYREVPPPPGRAARAAAYGLGALGLAGLATGIAFAVLTAQASKDVQNGGSVDMPQPFDGALRAKQDAARLYPIGTGVGFGIGALAIGGAVGLWVYGRKVDREAQHEREQDLAKIPMVAPFYASHTGGVAVTGRF